jgi:hypothetical protein
MQWHFCNARLKCHSAITPEYTELGIQQDDIEWLAVAYEEALRALLISDRDDPINEVIKPLGRPAASPD